MTSALLLATVLFMSPDSSASDTACVAVAPLISPLAHVTLWGTARHDPAPRALGSKLVSAGQLDSISFEDGDTVWTVWTVVTSSNGRNSCRSEYVGVNLATDADHAPHRPSVLFDISGRVVREPKVPGVYFERVAGRARRVVVLR